MKRSIKSQKASVLHYKIDMDIDINKHRKKKLRKYKIK